MNKSTIELYLKILNSSLMKLEMGYSIDILDSSPKIKITLCYGIIAIFNTIKLELVQLFKYNIMINQIITLSFKILLFIIILQ